MFEEKLKALPEKPGVYIMKDENDTIIYVGKAKILKNRVRQYFQNSKNHSLKTTHLVQHIKDFEFIVTNTEVEALILENNLIKKYTPKYNIMLKDDKTYPYIKVTKEAFPKVYSTRKVIKDGSRYFGPYTSSFLVKEVLDIVNSIWKIRKCNKKLPEDIGKGRACLNYHIGNCMAPCVNNIDEKEYNRIIGEVIEFLKGNYNEILNSLKNQMECYSKNLDFENAADVRDKIFAIKKLKEKQIADTISEDDRDVIGIVSDYVNCVIQIFFIRKGKITGREHFEFFDIGGIDEKDILTDFIKRFYFDKPFIPSEILIRDEIDDKEIIESYLSDSNSKKVRIIVPQKGEKKDLVNMVQRNAVLSLERLDIQIKTNKDKTENALKEIMERTGLKSLDRIESYDISNIQGFESVSGMVVFEKGKAKKSDYRKFRIKSVKGADDYTSVYEVILRRFKRYLNEKDENTLSFSKMPDAIFIDGGKGQITSVKKALNELNLSVEVCGMVKDDNHRTRGLIYNNEEIIFPTNSNAFRLITRIQDEVHRYSITYHKTLRKNTVFNSVLDEIEGVGEVKRKSLINYFGSVDKIKNLTEEEISQAPKIDKPTAKNIYNYFHKK